MNRSELIAELREFLGSLEQNPGADVTWKLGAVAIVARPDGVEVTVTVESRPGSRDERAEALQFSARAEVLLSLSRELERDWTLPWPRPTTPYHSDGPKSPVRFERGGHVFFVVPTNERGCDTGRVRFRVRCETCALDIHEATTGASRRVLGHLAGSEPTREER